MFPEKYLAKAVTLFDVAMAKSVGGDGSDAVSHVETVPILILTVCFLVKTKKHESRRKWL